ncbi:hypothetical protein EXE48_17690 [Halorubrum sp. ASP1]|nr:hypothetical protein EXE48_17690 [Halorubrum sp. ASP1]
MGFQLTPERPPSVPAVLRVPPETKGWGGYRPILIGHRPVSGSDRPQPGYGDVVRFEGSNRLRDGRNGRDRAGLRLVAVDDS